MTLVVPRDMPETGAGAQEFEPQRVDFAAPEAGGRLGGVQAGFPLWLGVWTIGRIGSARSDIWRAWHIRMRGSQRRFLGRDLSRPYPLATPNGFGGLVRAVGGAFNGAATSWSETIDGESDSLVRLVGMPAGLVLSIGDYIGFRWDDPTAAQGNNYRRALVRVIEPAVAGSDGAIIARCEPPVPTVVPAAAVAHLDRPACVMALVSDRTRLDAIDRRLAIRGGTIVGLQDLRP